LQVEHPVTELVWGLDLVELQLRIADGQPLPFQQADLQPKGHAFEARVYAEDPARGFLPTGGTVLALHEPSALANVRVDSSLAVGTEVGATYDPMLSKVIGWGPDRDSARRTLDAALASTTVLGITTNIHFLRTILADPDVIAGRLDTALVERIAADMPAPTTPLAIMVAAAAAALMAGERRAADPWDDRRGWRLGDPAWSSWRATGGDGQAVEVSLRALHGPKSYQARHNQVVVPVEVDVQPGEVHVTIDGRTASFAYVRTNGTTWLGIDGATFSFTDRAVVAPGAARASDGGATITSPMPGTVIGVNVTAGQPVAVGQPLIVVEAMKMEHTLSASIAGTVAQLLVRVGDRVALNQVVAVLEPAPAQED
jgi:acetyl-CoA/propionyl-CoA carboxylase, biotin carboxylase, biotin carboxyl carrier protein